eukprot:scaffold2.g7397.t1
MQVDDVFWLIGSWAAPLAAVLFTLLARRVAPRDAGRPAAPSALRRLAAAQLPPRGLWAAACGGVSGAEAAGVAVYLFVAAWWLGQGIDSELKGRADWRDQLNGCNGRNSRLTACARSPTSAHRAMPPTHPFTSSRRPPRRTPQSTYLRVGVALGNLLAPHLALLFLPVPRTNALTWLTGVPRTHLVRYHRWLGHATMWVLSAHGIAFYIYWGATDRRVHLGDPRGLLLYAADLVLRAGQAANLSAIAAAEVDAASGVATLRLRADPVLRHRPLSEAWVLLPMLSRWQWHPFTIASGGGSAITMHVKTYGGWTSRLAAALRARQPLADGWLSLRLHLTGLLPPPPPKSPPAKRHQGRVTPGDDGPSAPTFNLVAVAGGGAAPGAPPLPPRLPRASAFGWDLLRPAQPLSLGVLHLASVFCLGSMVIAVLLSSVALGLGYAAVWPVHWIRYLDARHAEALGDAAATVAPYADQAALARERCVVEGPVLRLPGPAGAALKASPGRPDVRAVLRAAAAEAGPGAVVGVYSGGPGPLLLAVRAAVGEVNREAVGGAWLELHEETVEL